MDSSFHCLSHDGKICVTQTDAKTGMTLNALFSKRTDGLNEVVIKQLAELYVERLFEREELDEARGLPLSGFDKAANGRK